MVDQVENVEAVSTSTFSADLMRYFTLERPEQDAMAALPNPLFDELPGEIDYHDAMGCMLLEVAYTSPVSEIRAAHRSSQQTAAASALSQGERAEARTRS